MTSTLDPSSPSLRTLERALPREWNEGLTSGLGDRLRARNWQRESYIGLLIGTALLYVVGLSASGYANQFYAAAAQSGTKNWTAFLFGSLDPSNFITVDKPPAALWIMGASVKIFGLNSWSVLVPQALEGVASVALLYAAVRRVSGHKAGLLAGATLATTPIATLMFRFDNPDALLVLLMTAAAYATVRAIEVASARWLALMGVLLGFAFLTKMMQSLLVVPGFAVAYLIAAPTSARRRIAHVLLAGTSMVVAAGWWIALVELRPAGARPYIGGSNHNSVLELIAGYNGLGRLTGSSNNGAVNGGTGGFSSSQTGPLRLFRSDMGSQISWLLPAAFVALAALVTIVWRRPRTDALRASVIVWGGWLIVTALVLSFASGIIHRYYTVALAPGIAALIGIGVVELGRRRKQHSARWWLAALVAATSVWSFALWGYVGWHSNVRWVLLGAGAVATWFVARGRSRIALVAPAVVISLFAAPLAYSVQTADHPQGGAIPTAGPMRITRPHNNAPPHISAQNTPLWRATHVPAALTQALRVGRYTWAAATTSDNDAASLELRSGTSVMAIGGYNGTDPAISLAAFKRLVAAGKIHYYIPDALGYIGSTAPQTSDAYAIERWIKETYTPTRIANIEVYDLRQAGVAVQP